MFVNMTMLTEQALRKLESLGVPVEKVYKKAWLLGVKLPSGQTVAAYPISWINPLAPPEIYMTDPACDEGVCNKEAPSKIARTLKRWCKDEQLVPAIKQLKFAIKGLET